MLFTALTVVALVGVPLCKGVPHHSYMMVVGRTQGIMAAVAICENLELCCRGVGCVSVEIFPCLPRRSLPRRLVFLSWAVSYPGENAQNGPAVALIRRPWHCDGPEGCALCWFVAIS